MHTAKLTDKLHVGVCLNTADRRPPVFINEQVK